MLSKSWKCYTEITNILFPESMGELITNTDYLEYEQVPDSGQVKNNGSTCSLVHHLQSLVTCPVCLGTIRAVPVLCCPSGHVTCSACRSQLSSCPVCRAAYPRLELVSHIAAGIIDQIPHPCKYKSYGCSESLHLPILPQHEARCSYRLVKCPNILCRLSVSLAGLHRHMMANGCASMHQLKVGGVIGFSIQVIALATQVTASCSSVFMTGRVRDLEEFQYKASI